MLQTHRRWASWGRAVCLLTAGMLLLAGCGAGQQSAGSDGDPGGRDQVYEITLATPLTQQGMMNGTIWWAEEIEERTGGRVKFEFYFSGALVSALETLPAIRDGRVVSGFLSDPYWPAEFPLWNIIGIPFETTDGPAVARTFYDLYQNNQAFRAEFERAGVHLLHVIPYSQTMIGGRTPLESLADLQGKRFRAIGHLATAMETAGAQPTAMDPTELYEALQREVMDGYAGFPFDVVHEYGLHEVAPYAADPGLGHYASAGIGISLQFWNNLPEELRQVITEVSEELQSRVAGEMLMEQERKACERLLAEGVELYTWPQQEVQAWKELLGDLVVETWKEAAQERGVSAADVDQFYREFHETYQRYVADSPYRNPVEQCLAG